MACGLGLGYAGLASPLAGLGLGAWNAAPLAAVYKEQRL